MPRKSLELAARTVPRYTSYPTAPHFHGGVTADTYRMWLSSLDPSLDISLYIHVPFCLELCRYCGCHTKATHRPEPIHRYTGALRQEVNLLGDLLGRRRLSQIHWGGGTPSILGPAAMEALANDISHRFETSVLREHAIELDPRHVDTALVSALKNMGVTRASFGVQDFSDHVQRAIGRIQSVEMVSNAVEMLRGAGIGALNFDLMYGLPEQTTNDVVTSATIASAMRPSRIALFGYAHVPWMKKHQRLLEQYQLPQEGERLEQAGAARKVFLSQGYIEIGFDHFALPDDSMAQASKARRLHRNFQGYTTDDAKALLGIGASAISHVPDGYAQNASDIGTYRRRIEAGKFATARGFVLSDRDRRRGAIIESILCNMDAEVPGIVFSPERQALTPYIMQGLVTVSDRGLSITEAGRPFARLVAATFDTYRQGAPSARHSRAI